MKKPLTQVLSGTVAAIAVAMIPPMSWAQDEIGEFDELRALIEINATDGDAGIQFLVDGEGWDELRIDDPYGNQIFRVKAKGILRDQSLTENFFESNEPPCDPEEEDGFPLSEFLARFPAGTYSFTAKTEEGGRLEGETTLTHNLPNAPEIISPTAGEIVSSSGVTLMWGPGDDLGECEPNGNGNDIALANNDNDFEIFGYQVVVEREAPEPLVVLAVDLPNTANMYTLSSQFLEDDAIYKFEIIKIEARVAGDNDENGNGVEAGNVNGDENGDEDEVPERGNQTISESFFCTFTDSEDCELPD